MPAQNKALVVRKGNASDLVRDLIAKVLNNEAIWVDNRNIAVMHDCEVVKKIIRSARNRGVPVFIEQGVLGPLLRVLDFKGYWMFQTRGRNTCVFWFIDGKNDPPKEHLITI